jgi:hypothetical protein
MLERYNHQTGQIIMLVRKEVNSDTRIEQNKQVLLTQSVVKNSHFT